MSTESKTSRQYRIWGYGETTDFASLEDAEAAIHECGAEFEAVSLVTRGDQAGREVIYDQDGDEVGEVIEVPATEESPIALPVTVIPGMGSVIDAKGRSLADVYIPKGKGEYSPLLRSDKRARHIAALLNHGPALIEALRELVAEHDAEPHDHEGPWHGRNDTGGIVLARAALQAFEEV